VAADAVGKGVCVYTQRLYEGYDKLYHQTPGRDVYGRSDCWRYSAGSCSIVKEIGRLI